MQLNKTGMEHFRPHCTAGNGTRCSKEGLRAELECVGGDTYGDGVDRGGGGGGGGGGLASSTAAPSKCAY